MTAMERFYSIWTAVLLTVGISASIAGCEPHLSPGSGVASAFSSTGSSGSRSTFSFGGGK